MASLDDFQEQTESPVENEEKTAGQRLDVEEAYAVAGSMAADAIDALADGANAAYEFIKDRVEEVSGMDLDGDGQVGTIRPEDVVAGAELAAEAVADTVGKAASEIASMTPEDMVAGAELAVEAVAGAVGKVAGDVVAGAELAAEALADAASEADGV